MLLKHYHIKCLLDPLFQFNNGLFHSKSLCNYDSNLIFFSIQCFPLNHTNHDHSQAVGHIKLHVSKQTVNANKSLSIIILWGFKVTGCCIQSFLSACSEANHGNYTVKFYIRAFVLLYWPSTWEVTVCTQAGRGSKCHVPRAAKKQ